jgi:anti-sigma B factor antagonist
MSQHPSLATWPTGDRAQVVTLEGEFDLATAPSFTEAVDDALDAGRPDLIVDLSRVTFLDSTMLQALIRACDNSRLRESQFALIRPKAGVWRIFVLTGLSNTLPSFGGVAEALASFAAVG